MRGWLALGLVSLVLLSGCAQKGDDGTTSTSKAPATHAGTPSVTATATGTAATAAPTASAAPAANRTNHPPTAMLAARAGNGTAALNVTFALKGSDPDGDALNWTLAFGDGNQTAGSALPSNVTHAYKAGGRLNATLTVTDGHNATTATVALNLTAGPKLPPVVFTGGIAVFDPTTSPTNECFLDLAYTFGVPFPSDTVGNIHDFPHAMDGWTYAFNAPGYWVQFWKGGSAILGSGSGGTVPKGSDQVWVCGKDAGTSGSHYTLTFTQP